MKVAIIFAGFFRTFPFIKQTFKDFIIDPLDDVDIFFSAPKTLFTLPEQEDPDWHSRHPFHSANEKLVDGEIIDFFGDRLKSHELIDYNLEPYRKLCKDNDIPDIAYNGALTFRILSQLSGKELSMKLFKKYVEENNIEYDLVIMTRGDNKYFTPFDTNLVDLNKIGYPSHNWNQKTFNHLPDWCAPSDKIPKAFNDQLLVGSQKNMLIWCDIVEKSFEYFREGMYYTAENLMAYHLMNNNIDWYGSRFIEYALWRNEEYE